MKQLIPGSIALLLACMSLPAHGQNVTAQPVRYELDGTTFESTFVFDATQSTPRPGILMVPNWLGPNEASLQKAREVAGSDYVVMLVDMYGVGVRPQNSEEASAAAGVLRGDRERMRARATKALAVFLSQSDLPLESSRMAAIGFCFGGGTVLELGRTGADLDAIVSFHGDLASPTLTTDAAKTRAKVLVLHGADDPYVPQEHVQEFIVTLAKTDVDWQLVQFGGTVHSFTNPGATMTGQAEYNERSSKRAFAAMRRLLDEVWSE